MVNVNFTSTVECRQVKKFTVLTPHRTLLIKKLSSRKKKVIFCFVVEGNFVEQQQARSATTRKIFFPAYQRCRICAFRYYYVTVTEEFG